MLTKRRKMKGHSYWFLLGERACLYEPFENGFLRFAKVVGWIFLITQKVTFFISRYLFCYLELQIKGAFIICNFIFTHHAHFIRITRTF